MENKRFGLGVFVCVFNKDFSKILLVKRNEEKRKKHGADWGNIGGKIEIGETSVQAGAREIKEEIGLKLKPSDLFLLQIKEQPNYHPTIHGIQFIYATQIDENTRIMINHEAEEYKWFDMKNLPEKMLDPKQEIIGWWRKVRNAI